MNKTIKEKLNIKNSLARMVEQYKKTKNGYVMLLTAVVFMMISFVIVFGLATPIIKQILSSRDIWAGKQAYYLSEAGIEDITFRIKNGETVNGSKFLYIDGFENEVLVDKDSLTGNYTITTNESDYNGYQRKIEATVTQSQGVSFNYGIQAGKGGFSMSGSSGIIGNVYSNGDITGGGSCYITGSAIVANSPDMFADQENYFPETPLNNIIFGTSTNYQDLAQSFKVSSTSPITQINLYIKKVGSPSDITLSIRADSSGKPHPSSVLSSVAISASLITTSYGWVEVPLSTNPNLVVGNTYWITLDASNNPTNYYNIAANLDSSYLKGVVKVGKINSTWYSANYDSYFKIFLGGKSGTISGVNQNNRIKIGSGSTGDAHAHTLSYVEAKGNLRCKIDILNNKICNKTYPDPSPAPMPISDGNIEEWKDKTIFTTDNSYTNQNSITVNGSNVRTLGKTKVNGNVNVLDSGTLNITDALYITGNLTVSNSGKLNVNGPIYVGGNFVLNGSGILNIGGTLFVVGNMSVNNSLNLMDTVYVIGNLLLDGSATIRLDSSFGKNSGIIVSDGRVTITGSGKATGSGQAGSYMIIVTTSDCPASSSCGGLNAVEMSGSGGAVILNAQKGTINFIGSANANEATANKIIMSGSTVVTYQSGIANPTFKEGPSGSFSIESWKELEE